jgi:hypothetical protein
VPYGAAESSPDPKPTAGPKNGIGYFFIPVWLLCCAGGVATAVFGGQLFIGALIAAVPTLLGVVLSPSFALCCIALMLPLGGALTYGGQLTGDRVVGGIATLGILAHQLATGKGIRLRGSPMLPLFLITGWGALSALWSREPLLAVVGAATLVQLCIYGVAVWNALAYDHSPIWCFRCYVIGMTGALGHAYLTGTFEQMARSGQRLTFAATTGTDVVNPNVFAGLLGLAFIVSVYLAMRDPSKWLRVIWISGAALFPGVMILSGSRGALLALGVAVGTSAVNFYSFWRSKLMWIALPLAVLVLAGGAYWSTHSGMLSKKTAERLSSSREIEDALDERVDLIKGGLSAMARNPVLGTGLANFLMVTSAKLVAHNDLVNIGAELGMIGLLFYVWYQWRLFRAFLGTRSPPEKWFMQVAALFIFICSCKGAIFMIKFVWFFTIAAAAIAHSSRQQQLPPQPLAAPETC